jgi:hypothetical protein
VDGRLYSLGTVLRSETETNEALKKFLKELGVMIERYALLRISGEPFYHWKLCGSEDVRAAEMLRGHAVSEGLMTALGVAQVRDRCGLKKFLEGVFKRWRKIHKPGSSWQIGLVESQLLGRNDKSVAAAIERSGDSPGTEKAHDRLMWRIRQERKREREKGRLKASRLRF